MNLTDKVSRYLTIADVIKSETAIRKGIDNSLPPQLLPNAQYIATKVYDPIKDQFPNAGCYSFYRGKILNKEVGGSDKSFHSYAGAQDIDTPGDINNRDIFKWVLADNVPFNELIWEYGNLQQPDWVHVGLLPGYTIKKILHIFNDVNGIKHRDELTKEQAIQLFKL